MTIKDASEPDYFDPAWEFLDKISEDIVENFEFGSFTIWPGYFENPVDSNDGYHLDILISPKCLEMYGGAEDGAEIFTPLTCDDILFLGENFLIPEREEMKHLSIAYKGGELRISGRYREDPKWSLTFVLNNKPQKEDKPGPNDKVNHRGFGLPT